MLLMAPEPRSQTRGLGDFRARKSVSPNGAERWGVDKETLFKEAVEVRVACHRPDAAPQGLRDKPLRYPAVADALPARLLNHRQHALQAKVRLRYARRDC